MITLIVRTTEPAGQRFGGCRWLKQSRHSDHFEGRRLVAGEAVRVFAQRLKQRLYALSARELEHMKAMVRDEPTIIAVSTLEAAIHLGVVTTDRVSVIAGGDTPRDLGSKVVLLERQPDGKITEKKRVDIGLADAKDDEP